MGYDTAGVLYIVVLFGLCLGGSDEVVLWS